MAIPQPFNATAERPALADDDVDREAARDDRLRREAVVAERGRVARELHDTLAQDFNRIALRAHLLRAALCGGAGGESVLNDIDAIAGIARDGVAEAHQWINALRSPLLEHGGLAMALAHLARGVTVDAGFHVAFVCDDTLNGMRFCPTVEGEMLRIAQEAVNNARRHSGARHAVVQLRLDDGALTLCVSDEGRGCDPTRAGAGGFGVTCMRERASRAGGCLSIDTKVGAGVRITVRVPSPHRPRPVP